jgi:hypothetical protein
VLNLFVDIVAFEMMLGVEAKVLLLGGMHMSDWK